MSVVSESQSEQTDEVLKHVEIDIDCVKSIRHKIGSVFRKLLHKKSNEKNRKNVNVTYGTESLIWLKQRLDTR